MQRKDILELFPLNKQTNKPSVWFTQSEVLDICERVYSAVNKDSTPEIPTASLPTKTEMIFNARSPYSNPFQGEDKRVLFVCSAGILRSATASRIYSRKYNTRCAGSKSYALIPVTEELLLWAQEIVFMNPENYTDVINKFDLREFDAKIVTLDIEDQYEHMSPDLIKLLNERYEQHDYRT